MLLYISKADKLCFYFQFWSADTQKREFGIIKTKSWIFYENLHQMYVVKVTGMGL